MVMGSDDSFTFTIPEGESRYLTMLVAANDGTSPSINLTGNLTNGTSWTTANSGESIVPSNYNFGNAEINSAGRLIRYELAPGTYTLQRGSADYLLYYMRLTKEKPEMTDVAQPLITDYELSWSGATYVNTDAKGNLKINDSKYIVDQDNLNHTVILKSENNSLASSLNLSTFTLSEIDVQLATKVIAFEDTNNNNGKITDNNQEKSAQSNTCTLDTYNAGNYATSGTIKINEPDDYKYSAFYEKLHLNSVQYEVKSPIIPRLYTSLDGDKLTPVDTFTNLDDAWAIGFKMPMVVPAPHSDLLPVSERYGNYTIDINIPEWTKRSDNTSTGLGVIVGNDKNYTLGKQSNSNSGGTEMLHPREGWTYKIAFESIPDSKQIVPSLNGGNKANDTDHYFIYNGTIAKFVTIPTPYEVINLNIQSLEFRSASVNGDNQTYNLKFNDDFYLKATISPEDAQKYAGKFVKLQGSFSNQQNGGNSSIDWSKSRQDGSSIVDRSNGGNSLQFEIKAGQTVYEIHWKFVRPEGNTSNPVQFTYQVNNSEYTGDNTATATINLSDNGQSSDSQLNISLDFYADVDGNGTIYNNGNNFNNLLLGTSRVYLKATLSSDIDLSAYNNQVVQLSGEFPSYNATNGGWAIHWANSRKNGDIYYYGDNQNGTGLQFTIDANNNKREYYIEWVFEPSINNYSGGEIGFNYNISVNSGSPVQYSLSGEQTAAIEFANEPTVWSGSHQWNEWSSSNYLTVTNQTLPAGTKIILCYSTSGGQLETLNNSDQSFRPNIATDRFTVPNDDIFDVRNGENSIEFTLSNQVNGLKLNGNNVTMTKVFVIYPSSTSTTETVIFDYNFNNNAQPSGYQCAGGDSNFSNGTLSFEATGTGSNDYDNQIRFTGLSRVNGATYKLTFKIKSNVSDSTGLDIAFDDPSDNYSWCGAFSDNSSKLMLNASGNFTEVTLTATAGKTIDNARLFINLGHLGDDCTIEIDDLKLVRTN